MMFSRLPFLVLFTVINIISAEDDLITTSVVSSTATTESTSISNEAREISLNSTVVPTTEKPIVGEEVRIGGICAVNECDSIQNSNCKEGLCQCIESYVRNENGSACLKIATNLGDVCIIQKQCDSVKGKCINNTCQTTIPSVLGDECAKGDSCDPIANSVCKEGICECVEHYVKNLNGSVCVKEATKLGDVCEVVEQCKPLKAICTDAKCSIPVSKASFTAAGSTKQEKAIESQSGAACTPSIDVKTIMGLVCLLLLRY